MKKIIISEMLYRKMQNHALSAYPNECCGFFYGEENGDIRNLQQVHEVENSQTGNQRRRFEISAYHYLQAERFAEDQGLTLLGVYHSHPDHPAHPSKHDLKQAVPFFSYIILSVIEDQVKEGTSWQLEEEKFIEEEIIIENQIETLN